jgi:hypothetical protein
VPGRQTAPCAAHQGRALPCRRARLSQQRLSGHTESGFNVGTRGPTPYREMGGAEGDRTPDLRAASAALSQLSYGPLRNQARVYAAYRGVSTCARLLLPVLLGGAAPVEAGCEMKAIPSV